MLDYFDVFVFFKGFYGIFDICIGFQSNIEDNVNVIESIIIGYYGVF